MIVEFKQCLDDINIVTYLFSKSTKYTTSYQREEFRLLVISIIFVEANNFRDVQILYQVKAFMELTPNEFIFLTSTCWDENYQPLTIDMTKHNCTGCYSLESTSLFDPDTNLVIIFN